MRKELMGVLSFAMTNDYAGVMPSALTHGQRLLAKRPSPQILTGRASGTHRAIAIIRYFTDIPSYSPSSFSKIIFSECFIIRHLDIRHFAMLPTSNVSVNLVILTSDPESSIPHPQTMSSTLSHLKDGGRIA